MYGMDGLNVPVSMSFDHVLPCVVFEGGPCTLLRSGQAPFVHFHTCGPLKFLNYKALAYKSVATVDIK